MQPPFFGTKILDSITLDEIEREIDREQLFIGRWQLRQNATSEEWEKTKAEKVLKIYEKTLLGVRNNGLVEPKCIYAHFKCRQDGNGLIVEGERRSFRFDFPREKTVPHRCLADFFKEGFVTMQIVTIGKRVVEESTRFFAKQAYSDMFFLKGFAAEATDALANVCNSYIVKELGTQNLGKRFSPGFPSFPSILEQKKIFELLKPLRIGISLTETGMLIPEYSTSAIISMDEKAEYFRP